MQQRGAKLAGLLQGSLDPENHPGIGTSGLVFAAEIHVKQAEPGNELRILPRPFQFFHEEHTQDRQQQRQGCSGEHDYGTERP